jgi:hypothetical protein
VLEYVRRIGGSGEDRGGKSVVHEGNCVNRGWWSGGVNRGIVYVSWKRVGRSHAQRGTGRNGETGVHGGGQGRREDEKSEREE